MAERRFVDPLLVALVASGLAVVVTGLWRGYLDQPLAYDRDGLLHLALIQNQIESGTWLHGPRLAAPFGQDNADFPLGGERLSWAGLWLLGRLTGEAATAANLWVLLSYPLVALAGWWGARRFGLSRASAVVVALAFAFLPYHTVRQNAHLLRVAYVAVPWASWWIVRALDERPFGREERRWLVVAAVATACCDTQHTIFFAVLFGAAALLTAIRARRWQPLLLALTLAGAGAGTLVANNVPYVQARVIQGANPVAGKRVVSEQERFGLRIVQMILPTSGHRIAPLAELKARTRVETLAKSEDGQSIGTLGVVGLFAALFAAFGTAASRRPDDVESPTHGDPIEPPPPNLLLSRLGVIAAVAMLTATGSGFAYLFSLGGLTSMRTWNRVSVFIAWFALVAAGVLLDRLWSRVRERGWSTPAIIGLTTTLVAATVLDTTTPRRTPNHDFIHAKYLQDRRFFASVERGLGRDAAVAQWPIQRYPEPPDLHRMRAYEHLAGYLHTDTLRWSYGGMAGRAEGDWSASLERFAPSTRAVILAATGFDAIYVDRAGLEGGVTHTTSLERGIIPVTGAAIYNGSERRRVLYDLREVRSALADGGVEPIEPITLAQLAPPVRLAWGRTFWPQEVRGGDRWRWSQRRGHIRLELDRHAQPQTVQFEAKIMSRAAPKGTIVVRGPQGEIRVPVRAHRGRLSLEIDVPAQGVDLWLSWEGPAQPSTVDDRRALAFRLINPVVYGTPRARELDCWAAQRDPTREPCATDG